MHHLETVACWALETSLAALILIIPALAAGLFLRKPIFTPIRHMLGLLIVARLLLPFALPSPLSIFNLIPTREASWSAASSRRFGFTRPSPAPMQSISISTAPASAAPVLSLPSQIALTPKHIQILPLLWSLGVLTILMHITFQHVKIRRFTQSTNQITSGPAVDALRSALELSRCRRTIKLYLVPNLPTPALFGLFRPSILLPAHLAQSNDFIRLRLVCLHEIAHLKRFDVLINWLVIFAQTLHWFNPFVWLTTRRLRADQELLCDADVMRMLHPDEHRAYGETLLALASRRNYTLSTLIPVSSGFKQLKERIAMINQFKPITNRLLVFALPALAAVLALVTFTAATKKPVKPPPVTVENDAVKRAKAISSLETLWAEKDALVREAEQRVEQLRKQLGIPPYSNESELYTSQSEIVNALQKERIRAEQEYVQHRSLQESLKAKSRKELIETLPTAYHDELLQKLMENLQKTEQQIVVMQREYTDDHPEVVKLSALSKRIHEQIDARVDGIMFGLEAVVAARKAVLDELSKQLEREQGRSVGAVDQSGPYFKAFRDLETLRKVRDSIFIRILQEKVDQQIAN